MLLLLQVLLQLTTLWLQAAVVALVLFPAAAAVVDLERALVLL